MNPISYQISESARESKVIIGQDLFAALADSLSRDFRRVVLITEDELLPLWGDRLATELGRAGLSVLTLTVPAGEASKTRAVKDTLEDLMLADGIDRYSVVIALGGGMICDLAAFTASTYMRGIPFVLVPTTTLAMADAAIGGKCAVNTPVGKNLIGTFALPLETVIDLDVLSTLPDREYREGLVEMLKLGFVADISILYLFEQKAEELAARDPAVLTDLLTQAVSTKISLITDDFRDTKGRRALLNYGHTYGHAIETESNYGYLHGEAVALGIRLAAAKALSLGLCDEAWAAKQNALLDRLEMPALAELSLTEADLAEAIAHDKKSENSKTHFVLSKGPGEGIFL